MKIIGLIPTRLNSSRLFKKPLLDIDGIPMIVHTFKRAQMCKKLKQVFVCTDSKKLKNLVEKYGGKAILTKRSHKTGTDRIAEVAKKLDFEYAIDIQGDFPLLDPKYIENLINFHLRNRKFDIVVPSSPTKDNTESSVVKVLMTENHKVLYLSRSAVPFVNKIKPKNFLKHMSIISFKRKSLLKFGKIKQSKYEKIEGVELLRAIENGFNVGSFIIKKDIFSVDVQRDYLRSIYLMQNDPIRKKY